MGAKRIKMPESCTLRITGLGWHFTYDQIGLDLNPKDEQSQHFAMVNFFDEIVLLKT